MRKLSGRRPLVSVVIGAAFTFGLFAFAPTVKAETAPTDCGENDGNVCWENESCLNILFYKQCTTKYKYYPGGGT